MSAEEARALLEEWLGASCDQSPLWDWSDDVRARVLDAAWAAYASQVRDAIAAAARERS